MLNELLLMNTMRDNLRQCEHTIAASSDRGFINAQLYRNRVFNSYTLLSTDCTDRK